MAYVYKHIRKDTGEVFYIGIGIKNNRAKSKFGRNNLWKKIVNKTDFIVEIIENDLTWQEACEKEKELISLYGRIDLGNGTLANMTDGGDGTINKIFTEEYRQKLKGPKSEEHKRKIGLASKGRNVGKKHTEEAKKKMSEASKGRNVGKKHTEETKKIISEKNKGKVSPNKGKPMSEEQKKKISETLKSNPVSYWTGKRMSEETKNKIRETLKKRNETK